MRYFSNIVCISPSQNPLRSLIFVILLSVQLIAVDSFVDESITKKRQPCNLAWVPMSLSDIIPGNSVPVDSSRHRYVARAQFPSSDGSFYYHAGTYDLIKDVAYFLDLEGTTHKLTSFEILTNPHLCKLSWEYPSLSFPDARLSAPVVKEEQPNQYVVKYLMLNPFAGHLYRLSRDDGSNYSKIYVARENGPGIIREGNYFQTLRSYSPGIRIIVRDFLLDSVDLEGPAEFIAEDIIRNPTPAEVRFNVKHRQRVDSRFRIDTSLFLSPQLNIDITLNGSIEFADLPIPLPVDLDGELALKFNVSLSINTTFERNIETEFTLEHEVIVPPYANYIKVCSILLRAEDAFVGYRAVAIYEANGLSNEEILEILIKNNITDARIENGKVKRDVNGMMSGVSAASTKFMVETEDSPGNPDGCTAIKNETNRRKSLAQKSRRKIAAQ